MVIYTQAVGKKGFLNRSAEKKKGSFAEIKLCWKFNKNFPLTSCFLFLCGVISCYFLPF